MTNLTNKYTLSINVRLAPVFFHISSKITGSSVNIEILFISQDATFICTHVYIESAIGCRHLVGAPWIPGSRRQPSAGEFG